MTRVGDLTSVVKSTNAGAAWLTFDLIAKDPDAYEALRQAPVLSAGGVADLYHVAPESVHVYNIDSLLAIKITIPRRVPGGGPDETDFDGTQQFAPLLTTEIEQ